MTRRPHYPHPMKNASGGAVFVIVLLLVFMSILGGGGYVAYTKFIKKPPLQTKLACVKIKPELVQFSHDLISPILYNNMVMMDDILVMMDKELDRLKRIEKKYPNQAKIVTPQIEELSAARDRLGEALERVTAKIEKIYVTWLVNQRDGAVQIRENRSLLTNQLAETIRDEAMLIGRVRKNKDATS